MTGQPPLDETGVDRLIRAVFGDYSADRLYWRELADDGRGEPYWREWYCEPPAAGQVWRAALEEWIEPDVGILVRRIYRVVMLDARTGNADRDRRDADRDGPAGPRPEPAEAASPPVPPQRRH